MSTLFLLREPTMSQGTAVFSCGLMEAGRWRELGQGCPSRPVGASLESLWDAVPEECQSPTGWLGGGGGGGDDLPGGAHHPAPGSISGLLRELSLADPAAFAAAPPSKRQCRSLSCSDELAGGCRAAWRPQGSRVWTAVEKRRCHSGGSVHRGAGGGASGAPAAAAVVFPAMQRSSSFSLPARSNAAALELPCFSPGLAPAFTGRASPSSSPSPSPSSSSSSSSPSSSSSSVTLSAAAPGGLYLSHEHIFPALAPPGASPDSSPGSTPELERRGGGVAGPGGGGGGGGLARSRSQPCALDHKKTGVKRRRPADSRPSLDLAKMTQKLRSFHSLSCPGIPGEDGRQSTQAPPTLRSPAPWESGDLLRDPTSRSQEGEGEGMSVGSDPAIEELGWGAPDYGDAVGGGDTTGGGGEYLWAGLCSPRKDMYQLGGMLDIEQIERN
ncbi:unnamed protein product [Arctogadus glacialis]